MVFGAWFKERRPSPAVLGAIVALVLAVAGLSAGGMWYRDVGELRARLNDPAYPVEPLLATIRGLWFPPADVKQQIEKRLKFELASMKRPIEKASKPEEFRAVDRVLAQMEAVCPASLSKQLEGVKLYRKEHEEAVDLRSLDDLVARDLPYGEAARSFLAKYPSSKHLPKVQGWLHRAQAAAESKDRAELDQIKVATREEVEQKLARIDAFLAKYPLTRDATEMRRAAEVGRKLLATTTVKVEVSAAGRFNSARPFSVQVAVDGRASFELFSDGNAQEATWGKDFAVAWTPGQPLSVTLRDYQWVNEDAARASHPGIWAIRGLTGRQELEPVGTWEPYFEGRPWVTFDTPDISANDWVLIDAYLPSAEW